MGKGVDADGRGGNSVVGRVSTAAVMMIGGGTGRTRVHACFVKSRLVDSTCMTQQLIPMHALSQLTLVRLA